MRRVTENFIHERPPYRHRFWRWLGIFYFWLAGWKLEGRLPAIPKLLLVAGPHTSNWDGWNLIITNFIAQADLKWMIKEEATHGLMGRVIKWAGGLPVRRNIGYDIVRQSVQQIEQAEHLLFLVAPEGTRKKTDHWKTGFYWIAHQSQIPIICARMDYSTKTISFTGPYTTTGDIEADIQQIWEDYRPIVARYPELVSDMRLRDKDKRRFNQANKPADDQTGE